MKHQVHIHHKFYANTILQRSLLSESKIVYEYINIIGVEYDGAEPSSPRQLSVKDSGKYIYTEYEIMTISIKNNYTVRIFYQ